MNKSEFDAEFERLFDEAAENSEPLPTEFNADPSASWRTLQQRLQKEQRKAVWLRRAKWASVSAASLIAGAMLFSTLHTTEAFRPMFEMVYKAKNNTINVSVRSTENVSTEGAKTPPPPPDDMLPPPKLEDNRDLPNESAFRRVKVTLEEAASAAQFAMPIPAYIPSGYTLQEATVHITLGESKASAVKLVYQGSADNQGQLEILFRKRSFSANADRPDGIRTFTAPVKGGGELEWNNQDINIIVRSAMTEQELNKIGEGLKVKQ
ncbi:hypothetical protein [Paenibacillus radicis (ex Xue et al. 2023)]|uniref:DUF4367 domain-containing protein n=1 Tax=Paenibacillus radicis (ex Xue et al. 2023) TaxID=2972489 RepID=A0ABT1YLE3_9BACL|nr:hypothetical protein [Paenibacillus radicis (ex Xue et al. 2023)]MCR8634006.1 hypothetical protein [Paenibacillus radicis (ex Xue et al. 2023)]